MSLCLATFSCLIQTSCDDGAIRCGINHQVSSMVAASLLEQVTQAVTVALHGMCGHLLIVLWLPKGVLMCPHSGLPACSSASSTAAVSCAARRVFSLHPIEGYKPPTLAGHRDRPVAIAFTGAVPCLASTAVTSWAQPICRRLVLAVGWCSCPGDQQQGLAHAVNNLHARVCGNLFQAVSSGHAALPTRALHPGAQGACRWCTAHPPAALCPLRSSDGTGGPHQWRGAALAHHSDPGRCPVRVGPGQAPPGRRR